MNEIKSEIEPITNVYLEVLNSKIHIFVEYKNMGVLDIFDETNQKSPVIDFYQKITNDGSICPALEKYYTKKLPRKNMQDFLIKKGLVFDDGTLIIQFKNALDDFVKKY